MLCISDDRLGTSMSGKPEDALPVVYPNRAANSKPFLPDPKALEGLNTHATYRDMLRVYFNSLWSA